MLLLFVCLFIFSLYISVGLSLKSQELTAIFLIVRLCCSWIIEYDIHTILDLATLISTLWVIYMMRFKLNSSYTKELDNMPRYYVVSKACMQLDFICFLMITYFFESLYGKLVPPHYTNVK